jgi:hypothetical protein
VVGFTTGSIGKIPGKTCENGIRNNSFQFNLFIYVLDNSQIWPIIAKHKNNSTGYH